MVGHLNSRTSKAAQRDDLIPVNDSGFGTHVAIVGDPAMERVLELAESVARTTSTVLLSGESGAGKEVVGRHIHRASARADGPFVAVNCAALPQSIIESELFGHEKGAFSGAVQRHIGVFERASGGTLLLDEISEIPPEMQAKLLRVLQEKVLYRVGGKQPIKLNMRVIATTNRDLKKCVEEGSFRRDLYYRVNVFPLQIPPLRQRRGDVRPMCTYFLGKLSHDLGKKVVALTADAMTRLENYAFPGNTRELINILERAVILCGDDGIVAGEHIHLDESICIGPMPATPKEEGDVLVFEPGKVSLGDVRRQIILSTLAKYNGNRTRTAEALGVSLRTIRNRLKEYREMGIAIPE